MTQTQPRDMIPTPALYDWHAKTNSQFFDTNMTIFAMRLYRTFFAFVLAASFGVALAENTHLARHGDDIIVLTNDRDPNCPGGWYQAGEEKRILGEWKWVRDLCYKVNESKGLVEFKDPAKMLFGSFTLNAASFDRIEKGK